MSDCIHSIKAPDWLCIAATTLLALFVLKGCSSEGIRLQAPTDDASNQVGTKMVLPSAECCKGIFVVVSRNAVPREVGRGPIVMRRGESLRFAAAENAADVDLLELISVAEHLSAIDLDGCNHITALGVGYLLQCRHISSIQMCECSPDGVSFLLRNARHWALLTKLKLAGGNIYDDDVTGLLNLDKLKVVDLSRCNGLTDRALASLARLAQLDTLILSGCTGFTDNGLLQLVACRKLETIDLRSSTWLSDAGLGHLSMLKSGKVFALSGCQSITAKGVQSLLRHSNIEKMALDGCVGISESDVEEFIRSKPECVFMR